MKNLNSVIMNASVIEQSITCPISHEIMKDPYIGIDGQTYEFVAIKRCLERNPISPITRQPMTVNDLTRNIGIKYLCDQYRSSNATIVSNSNTNANTNANTNTKDCIEYNLYKYDNTLNKVMISLNISEEYSMKYNDEVPHDICLIIDRSGSMRSVVSSKDENNNVIEHGLTIQDIVNHAAKTVANTLTSNSRLAVIIFDNDTEVIFDFIHMTDINKDTVCKTIDEKIMPRGLTNIWKAVTEGLDLINNRSDKKNNSAIMILTDGMPNISPAKGEVETLIKLRNNTNFDTPIYTFAFGNSLRGDLLYNIAKYGNGGNGYIPDGGMVATVFCNYTGVILTTLVENLQLHIRYVDIHNNYHVCNEDVLDGDYASFVNVTNSIKPENVLDDYKFRTFDIGTIQIGQTRDILLKHSLFNNSNIDRYEYYFTYTNQNKCELMIINKNSIDEYIHSDNLIIQEIRYYYVKQIKNMINCLNKGEFNKVNDIKNVVYETINIAKTYIQNENELSILNGYLHNLVGNSSCKGEIEMAILNNNFQKWGENYLNQLCRAINQQQKPNFKDQSCQFGGTLFTSIVDKASDIFDNLPPPTPSNIISNINNVNTTRNYNVPPINIAAYNNVHGGCFHSDCNILMADNTKKQLKYLNKNDYIMSVDKFGMYTYAKIVCVFETRINNKFREFVSLENGLYITPWHPVKHNNKWVYPNTIKEPEIKSCYSVITLVLDSYHIGIVNDTECIMLGHEFNEGILKHDYFGTSDVINDLKTIPGWKNGYISVSDKNINYKIKNNVVTGMLYNQ